MNRPPTMIKTAYSRSLVFTILLCAVVRADQAGPRIRMADYEDKVYASWIGQAVGNMYGLAHEGKYIDQPRTQPIAGYGDGPLNEIRKCNGAYSDDDTDIEYVMLFCMEKNGPEPTYEQLGEYWKRHINNWIWCADLVARRLMDQGYLPPQTGWKSLNYQWFQIDPQLTCEIWATVAPGMCDYAAAKADWAARVVDDDYGTHPTIWYDAMYAAAFFETDVEKLYQIGYDHLPPGSVFRTALDDVRKWKAEAGDDWVAVRRKVKEQYYDGQGMPADFKTSHVGAILNGAAGAIALLYGQGDFEKTLNLSCMIGFDADNQCATLAGLTAIMHGGKSIPRQYTHILPGWDKPLNDLYKNRTRDGLPDGRFTDIARRTAAIGRKLVVMKGGRVEPSPDGDVLVINPSAQFDAPLEVRLFPLYVEQDSPVTIKPVLVGHVEGTPEVTITGELPSGMKLDRRDGLPVLTGTPDKLGRTFATVCVDKGNLHRCIQAPITVRRPNLANSAGRILAAVETPTGKGSRLLDTLRDGDVTGRWYDSYTGENLTEDFFGYEWPEPVRIHRLVYDVGPVSSIGGWFDTLKVQYRDAQGQWQDAPDLRIDPPFTPQAARKGYGHFELTFGQVDTTAIRIVGRPGGQAQYTSIRELFVPKPQ